MFGLVSTYHVSQVLLYVVGIASLWRFTNIIQFNNRSLYHLSSTLVPCRVVLVVSKPSMLLGIDDSNGQWPTLVYRCGSMADKLVNITSIISSIIAEICVNIMENLIIKDNLKLEYWQQASE